MKTKKPSKQKIVKMEQHRRKREEQEKQLEREYKKEYGFTRKEYVAYLLSLDTKNKKDK